MNPHKDVNNKTYYLIARNDVELFVTNRPNKNIDEVEYTDVEINARRFQEEDFKIIELDNSKHKIIEINKVYTIETYRKERPIE